MNKLLTQAQQQHQQGLLNEALENYQLALKENPLQPDVWHCIGIVLAQLENYKDSLNHLIQAIKQDPHNPTFYNSKGNVLSQLGRLREATTAYDMAIKLKPDYVVAYTNIANCFYRQKKIENAKKTYQKALTLYPCFANAHFNYGRLLAELEDYESALIELKKTIALDNKHASAYGQLAHIYLHHGNYDQAIEHYLKRLILQPHHADSHHDLALALLKDKQYEKASEHFEQSIILQTTQAECSYHLATTYLYLGKYKEALTYYLRQLETGPHVASYYNIGVLHMYHERHREALDYFQHALTLNPRYWEAHINMGAIYLKLSKSQDAISHYELALTLNPADAETKHILSALKQDPTPHSAPTEYVNHLFNQYAPYYDQHLSMYLHYRVPQTLYQTIDEELNSTSYGSILDLGCGTGLCGEWFKAKTKKLIGIDLAENMLAVADHKKIYDELKKISVLEALDKYKNLDLILAADVFTYIGDLDAIFSKASLALLPQGYFAFTVEKTYQPSFILQQTIRYAHNKKYLKSLIKNHEFQILRFDNIVLRKQFNTDVEGYLVLLKKIAPSSNQDLSEGTNQVISDKN